MYPRILQQIQSLTRRGSYVLTIHAENGLGDDGFTEEDLETAMLNGAIVRREKDSIGRLKYVLGAPRQMAAG